MGLAGALLAALAPVDSALAQVPLGDLNLFTLDPDSTPGPFVATGGSVFFAASTAATGREPYVLAPGAGASLVLDLHPGPASSTPEHAVLVGGLLLFFADDGQGQALWATDGTASGTRRVAALRASPGAAVPQIVVVGGLAVLVGLEASTGAALWVSDGAVAGTRRLFSFGAAAELAGACRIGTDLLATVRVVNGPELLLRSDATATGTRVVTSSQSGGPGCIAPLVEAGGRAYFPGQAPGTNDYELWTSDGTAVGTYQVASPNPGRGSYLRGLIPFGNRVAYLGNGASYGDEPIVSDGTVDGTVIVDVNRLVGRGSSPAHLTALGNDLLLLAFGTSGPGLHHIEGAQLRVSYVQPLRWRDDGGAEMVAAGGHVFLRAFDVAAPLPSPAQLWVSDGTAPGTQLLRELRAGRQDARFAHPTALGSSVVFAADDGLIGQEPWFSDGTALNTRPAANLHPGAGGRGSGTSFFLPARQRAVFDADDGLNGRAAWRTDGAPAGTTLLTTHPSAGASTLLPLGNLAGDAMFSLTPPGGAATIYYRSDGASGSRALAAPALGAPLSVAADGDRVIWLVASALGGAPSFALAQLSRAGLTVELASVREPRALQLLDGEPLLAMWTAATGYELATRRGLVRDLRPGPLDSDPGRRCRAVLGGLYLFDADDGGSGAELWRSDGSAAGTFLLADLVPGALGGEPRDAVVAAGAVFFVATVPALGAELWATDGTTAGTRLVRDVALGAASAAPRDLLPLHGGVYFTADDGVHGREAWFSDGSSAGTRLVADLRVGALGAEPRELRALGSRRLLFTADDGREGRELWTSEGTAATTRLAASVRPGPSGSDPVAPTLTADGLVLLRADDGQHGAEPWAWDPGAVAQAVSGDCGGRGLQLAATDPVLGGVSTVRVAHPPAVPAGVLVLGAPRFDVLYGCTLYVDASQVTLPFTFAGGQVLLPLSVPNQPSLAGRSLRLQAAAGPVAAPPGLAFSAAWSLRLGR
jgi:ELWxxDGT repeat protein